MRADAQRNRARVLQAAEVVLARDGLDASIRAIAETAGVGLGTIYRHFPTQADLYQAIVNSRMRRLLEEAAQERAAADPGAAFFVFFTRIVVTSARNKALTESGADPEADPKAGLDDVRRDMRAAIEASLVRAQAAGAVRGDLAMPELLALLAAACLGAERHQWDDELRTRTLALIFDGLRVRR